MADKHIFTPEALDDIDEGYSWYEEREYGLGEDFLHSIEECISSILRVPRGFPVALLDFRRAPVRRFPYEIFYEIDDETIKIYAVFHCSQDPYKWRQRLER
jgi:plasmid stabilization system protein ParE